MKLILKSQWGHPVISCDLHESHDSKKSTTSYERFSQSVQTVFSDVPYSAAIEWEDTPPTTTIELYMNGEVIDFTISNSDEHALELSFKSEAYKNGDVFRDSYGYIQIGVVCIWPDTDRSIEFFTDYLGVMLRVNRTNIALQKMAEYVYRMHDRFMWKRDTLPSAMAQLRENNEKSLDVQIELIRLVIQVYEHNLSFFKVNPHTRAEHSYRVDDSIKLQQISSKTLQYIAQHPDELSCTTANTGIVFEKQSYFPRKSLVVNTEQSRATYENRMIIAFLHGVISTVQDLRKKVSDYLSIQHENVATVDGYISSSVFILETTKHHLRNCYSVIVNLEDRLNELFWTYKKFLPFNEPPISSIPQATSVFLSLAQYRQMYDTMLKWFSFGSYDLSREMFMLPLLVNHQLYEYYVLLKFADAIEHVGFQFYPQDSSQFAYPVQYRKYKPVDHTNTFVFRDAQDNEITLYYQPVIWGQHYSTLVNNGIHLQRTTTASLGGRTNGPVFYTPDYVIKHRHGDKECYLIADAKLQSSANVWKKQVLEISFKYQFSVRPTDTFAKIIGVCILYGKSVDEKSKLESVHNIMPAGICPDFWITSLTESDVCTEETHYAMFDTILNTFSKER